MNNRPLFLFSAIGAAAGLVGAYLFSVQTPAQPPAFNPAMNPYAQGIYANGIVESDQDNGANINIYPEVAGRVTAIRVHDGDIVHAGDVLLNMDDSVQRATFEQQKAQADAALTQLQELKAQPRKESLAVVNAQRDAAEANRKAAQDQYDKQRRSYQIDPKSVSKDSLDSAEDALNVAQANLQVAQRQFDLTRAGAWGFDIDTQQKQYAALQQASHASSALLDKYTLVAPVDGVVLSINAAVGGYVSGSGVYGTYTQSAVPVIVMGTPQENYSVRCYIDEILVGRLPDAEHIRAQMSLRGSDAKIALEFVRIQPYVSPKIQLSDQRQERVDLRVLPVIFRFAKAKELKVYPGQLVDVYVGSK